MDRGLAEGHQAVTVEFIVNHLAPGPDQPGTTLFRRGRLGADYPDRAEGPNTMAGALVFAVRDVLPSAGTLDAAAIAAELEKGLLSYWGPDHGITTSEMLATARDIKTSTGTTPLD